jgi:hypothetical protein
MTFRVNRTLLRRALESERLTLSKQHTKAVEQYDAALLALPEKLLVEIDRLRAKVAKGSVPLSRYGDVQCGLSKAPSKPSPDCRISDIDELLRLLALSTEDTVSLNDKSKFYRYACKI